MKGLSSSTVSPPFAVIYIVVLSLLAACRAGASLHLLPSLSHLRVDVGDDARLDCYLSTDGQSVVPPGAFSWTDGGGRALSETDDERISISLSEHGTVSTLRISSVVPDDEDRYTCSYTGLSEVSIMLDVVIHPHFKNVSENQEFVEGTDAVVECPAFLGEPSGEMLWFDEENNYIRNDHSQFTPEDGQLIIQDISMDNAGLYCCRLLRFSNVIDTRCIQVVVREQADFAPEIVEPANPILVMYEDPLELECELAAPQENVEYSWSVHTDFEQTHTADANATLYREAKKFLSGHYTCKAQNIYGYDTQVYFVKVLAPPLPDECSRGTMSGAEGSKIVLSHCDITSPVQLADLTYEWRKNGEVIDLAADEKTKYQVNHEGYLTINSAESADSGAYEVVISNDWGRAVHSVQLDITSSPQAMIECTLEVEDNEAGYTCVDIQDMKEQVSQKLMSEICDSSCSNENLTNSIIRCPSEQPQTRGVFTATLVGPKAQQLAAKAIERGQFSFGLTDDLALSVVICDGSCSEPEVTQPLSSMTAEVAGGVVAVVIIVAMVTVGLIITVILVKYRRGKLTTQVTDTADPEKATPTISSQTTDASTIMENTLVLNQSNAGIILQPPTPLALNGHTGRQPRPTQLNFPRPACGRSLSLELPRKHNN